jgi:hypothetical protein
MPWRFLPWFAAIRPAGVRLISSRLRLLDPKRNPADPRQSFLRQMLAEPEIGPPQKDTSVTPAREPYGLDDRR